MKKYLAEMVGTFVLTLLGCGTAVSLGCGADTSAIVGTAIAFGLSVIAMAYTIGGISGCHINPAITLGVLLNGGISAKDACGYICGQVIGAIIAAAVLYGIVSMDPAIVITTATGANACTYGVVNGLIVEIVLTCIFVLVVLRYQQLCRSGHRSVPDSHPPRRHPLHRYERESCPQHRSCSLCRRSGSLRALGLHRRSLRWCGLGSRLLEGDSTL